MPLYFALAKPVAYKVDHGCQIVDTLLEEEAVDEAAGPRVVRLHRREVQPEALEHIDRLLDLIRLVRGEDVSVEGAESDASHDVIVLTGDFLVLEQSDESPGLVRAEVARV